MSFEEKHKEGYELLHEKDLDRSLDIARELQKMNPDAPEGYTLEGEVMQKLSQWDTSIKSLNTAIGKESENGRLYNLRGYSYLNIDDAENARKDFEKAIALDNLPTAHRNLVLYKLMSGNGKEAISYLLDRIRSEPSDVENWILMGDLMQKGGHENKAKTYYEQALKMDPENEYVKELLNAS
ncbi:MAG: tetratricopeptide repeat protein [Balneolaceae bacterium]